jgi:hypothetical protein
MNAHRLVRRIASTALLAGSTLMLPSILEAACQTQRYWTSSGWREKVTCCGDDACCTTVWSGSTLVDQTCA